jgi:shikimate kinase
MKIFLVGLSGSGKTTLGEQLAEHLNVPFIDMDWEIEKKENKSISDIFSQEGEDHFRQIEAEILREWTSSTESFVMGTGGGAPCFYNGMDVINDAGLSIFLDVSVEELRSRLAKATDRPLLHSADETERENRLYALRTARLPVYRRAHIIIQEPTLDKLLNAVLKGKAQS